MLSTDVRGGGSTKQRSAISHPTTTTTTSSSSSSSSSSDAVKLIYSAPLTLLKLFRSLALVQTAGCIVGCVAMAWQVLQCCVLAC